MIVTRKLLVLVAIVMIMTTAAGSLVGGWLGYHVADRNLVSKADLVPGCQSNGEARVANLRLYNDLVEVNQGQIDALKAGGVTNSEQPVVDAQQYAKRQYQKDRAYFLGALGERALNPGGSGPNGVRTDCYKQYDLPRPQGDER